MIASNVNQPAAPARATLLVKCNACCNDGGRVVAAVSELVFKRGGNVLDADRHVEQAPNLLLMRMRLDLGGSSSSRQELTAGLAELSRRLDFGFELTFSHQRRRFAVFVGRTSHCLYDLCLAGELGDLPGDCAVVVSNHRDCEKVAAHFALPFVYVPVAQNDPLAAEAIQQAILADYRVELLVLARYMRILSAGFIEKWPSRIINIHHGFLPAFGGARAYHQAKERGVKIIGATAHYATADLDQGPIIAQDVCPVSHRDDVEDMMKKGRDLERRVLTRAVRLHLQRRILVWNNRTIVFR